jgi:tRNA1(Val) A37 N6-methylase TrmN6
MNKPEEIFVLNKQIKLLQPESGFRTSLDSVMLAAACQALPGQKVIDMGCGVGSAGLCLMHRVKNLDLTGVDIRPEVIELAKQNASINNFDEHMNFVCEDILEFTANTRLNCFDHAICNPPYLEAGKHIKADSEELAQARGHDRGEDISRWFKSAHRLLKPGGVLTLIHRADMVDKLVQALASKFGAVEIIPLWPRKGQPAKRIIIRAAKDRKSPASLYPGIVLHKEDSSYTPQADIILRQGLMLDKAFENF